MTPIQRHGFQIGAFVLIVACAYVAFSPMVAMWQLRGAFASGDETKIADFIDIPAVHDDLQASVLDAFHRKLASGNPFQGMGDSLMSNMVDEVMTPSALEMIIEHPESEASGGEIPTPGNVHIAYAYHGWDQFRMNATVGGRDVEWVAWCRHSLISWKICRIHLNSLDE